jgi:hypothetical protein
VSPWFYADLGEMVDQAIWHGVAEDMAEAAARLHMVTFDSCWPRCEAVTRKGNQCRASAHSGVKCRTHRVAA